MAADRIFTEYTPAQYFGLSKASENVRLEYDRGWVYAMAGGSPDHITITTNISFALKTQGKPRGCTADASDTKVGLPNETYYYPDVVVTCGEKAYERRPEGDYVLLNPLIVVEVSSESTQRLDRLRKLDVYQAMPSVQHCLIVSQGVVRVVHWARTAAGWHETVYTDLTHTVTMGDFGLRLAEIYEGVLWEDE